MHSRTDLLSNNHFCSKMRREISWICSTPPRRRASSSAAAVVEQGTPRSTFAGLASQSHRLQQAGSSPRQLTAAPGSGIRRCKLLPARTHARAYAFNSSLKYRCHHFTQGTDTHAYLRRVVQFSHQSGSGTARALPQLLVTYRP